MPALAFFGILIFMSFLSCGTSPDNSITKKSNTNPAIDSIYKIVMIKHDEVMPKDSEIVKLISILRQKLDDEKNELKRAQILGLIQELQSSHDAMMVWMQEFKNEHLDNEFYEKNSAAEITSYLKNEEKKIEQVAVLMLESIKNTELYLNENTK